MRRHTAAEMGKSGQIRDTKPKKGLTGVQGVPWFFRNTSLKIGTDPENPGRMVSLPQSPGGVHTVAAFILDTLTAPCVIWRSVALRFDEIAAIIATSSTWNPLPTDVQQFLEFLHSNDV